MLIVSLVTFQILIFIALIIIFRKILGKNVILATKHLEELNQEYGKKDMEVSRRLDEARKKHDDILGKAQSEAKDERDRIIRKAEEEKEKVINDARSESRQIIEQAEKSRRNLIGEIEERIAKEAINKACGLIQMTLPEDIKKAAHAKWTDELVSGSLDELKELNIPEDVNEVIIKTPYPLEDRQKAVLKDKVKALLDRDVQLKVEEKEDVVAGIIVSIGSIVMDGSLKNKIDERLRALENESG